MTNKTSSISLFPPKPLPRTIVCHTNFQKWQGCIYFSSYDLTGQILLLLKTNPGNCTKEFLKAPIYFFSSTSKIEIETKMSETLQSLFKQKLPGGA